MTCTAKDRIHAGAIFQKRWSMWNVTLEAVLILHVRTVRFMTLGTLQVLSMDPVTRVTVKFGMSTGLTLHVFKRPIMACDTCGFYILDFGKIKLHWCMRIVTFRTAGSSKMPVFRWIMTFLTPGNNILPVRRVFLMALNALEIFKVGSAALPEGTSNIIMAGSTPVSSGLVCPDIYRRLVRTVTCQTVGNGKILRMLLVAVSACVISSLCQSVTIMTAIAVLPGMSAGELLHVPARLLMACDAAWPDIFKSGKISN